MPSHPNIVWIQTDEQRPDSLSCYGSQWAKTPALAELAATGIVFRNAVCQAPVCVPSRSSQLSARYPQEIGVLNNWATGSTFPKGTITFPEIFAEAGYDVVSFGKRHTPRHPIWAKGTTSGVNQAITGFCSLAEGYDNAKHHVVQRGGTPPLIVAGTYPADSPNQSATITDEATAYLEARTASSPPFLLRVSHIWPHTPVLPPAPFDTLYDPDDLPIRFYDEQANATRAHYDRVIAERDGMKTLSRTEIRQVWKDYMGLCAYVDSEVGRLLSALDRLGMRENTIILYSADHGKLLGEWGAGEKDVFDSEVWRVPFVWSWPGHIPERTTRTASCELIDTARTLLTLAGLANKIPATYQGRPLFHSEPSDAVFGATRSEWYFPKEAQDLRLAIRTERYRMDVTWPIDGSRPSEEDMDGNLFDLRSDPWERRNLWKARDYASARTELIDRLQAWYVQTHVDPRLLDPTTATGIWHPSEEALSHMKARGLEIKIAGVDGWPPERR